MGAEEDEAKKAFSEDPLSINLVKSSTQERNKKTSHKLNNLNISKCKAMLHGNICKPSSSYLIILVPCSLGSCSLATSPGP